MGEQLSRETEWRINIISFIHPLNLNAIFPFCFNSNPFEALIMHYLYSYVANVHLDLHIHI